MRHENEEKMNEYSFLANRELYEFLTDERENLLKERNKIINSFIFKIGIKKIDEIDRKLDILEHFLYEKRRTFYLEILGKYDEYNPGS